MNLTCEAIWLATRGIVNIFGHASDVSISGDEITDGSVVAMKHRNNWDFFLSRYLSPKNAKIFATRKAFKPGASYFLRAAGFVPLTNPLTSENGAIDSAALRDFYSILKAGGVVVYAPEAACFPNRIGEKLYPEFIMKAAALKYDSFLVGTNYKERRIEVRIKQYNPGAKPKNIVEEDMRAQLTKLSGLEGIVTPQAAELATGNY